MPLAAAWVRNNWIVWTSNQVFEIDENGKVNWTFSTVGLPALGVSSGRETAVNDAGDGNEDGSILTGANGSGIQVRQGAIVVQRAAPWRWICHATADTTAVPAAERQ